MFMYVKPLAVRFCQFYQKYSPQNATEYIRNELELLNVTFKCKTCLDFITASTNLFIMRVKKSVRRIENVRGKTNGGKNNTKRCSFFVV